MKNGKLRIAIGWLLVILQVFSWIGMRSPESKLWNDDVLDTYQSSASTSKLNFKQWCFAFRVGNEKYLNSFSNIFIDKYEYIPLTATEYASVYIREALGSGNDQANLSLSIFDFNILIGYLFYGLVGLFLLIFGYRSKNTELGSSIDNIESGKVKWNKVLCIILLTIALILRVGKYSFDLFTLSLVFLLVFFIFYLGKKKSILFASSIILFALKHSWYFFTSIFDLFTMEIDTLNFYAFPTLVFAVLSLNIGILYLICGIKLYSGSEKKQIRGLNCAASILIALYALVWPVLLSLAYSTMFFSSIDISALAMSLAVTIYITKIPCKIDARPVDATMATFSSTFSHNKVEHSTKETLTKEAACNSVSSEPVSIEKTNSSYSTTDLSATGDSLFCKHCNAKLPHSSVYCNKCGAKVEVESALTTPPLFIESLFLIGKEHVGKYVQLIGIYSWTKTKAEPLKCSLFEGSRRSSIDVGVELAAPLPDYVVKCYALDRQPIVLRGILTEKLKPFHEYVLTNAVYQGYWRNEIGQIRCSKESCTHKCSNDCPIHLTKLGKEKYDEYNREEAVELFKRAVFFAPDFSEAWCNLGYAYLDSQRHTDAYEAFCEAEKYYPDHERILYGKIISLSKVGRYKEATDLLEMFKNLFPKSNSTTLSNVINGNIESFNSQRDLNDAEHAALLSERGFDTFWKNLIAEKERTFATKVCKYTGSTYRLRCEQLERFFRSDLGCNSKKLLNYRKALLEDQVCDADVMILFDVLDEYEHQYVRY